MNASITPLRYPGGKQRISKFVVELLRENNLFGGQYVEPYAGGAGVGIELLAKRYISRLHINDADLCVYAFWYAAINHTEEFCRRIWEADLTVEEWKQKRLLVKVKSDEDLLELGFSTFYVNRCNRSGVLTGGLIGGVNQDGPYKMDARFNRRDLVRRVEIVGGLRDRISIYNLDAEAFLAGNQNVFGNDALIYFDPPYFQKGSLLYQNYYRPGDHARLASIVQNNLDVRWIMSYDAAPAIVSLYSKRRHFLYDLQHHAANAVLGKEVFIFGDNVLLPPHSELNNIQIGLKNLVVPVADPV